MVPVDVVGSASTLTLTANNDPRHLAANDGQADSFLVRVNNGLLEVSINGHVASLFPHAPGLEETERLVIHAEPQLDPYVERVTLTPPALRGARRIVFLVTGEQKAEAVAGALAGPPDPAVPGSLIRSEHGETLAILDRQAASRLGNRRD